VSEFLPIRSHWRDDYAKPLPRSAPATEVATFVERTIGRHYNKLTGLTVVAAPLSDAAAKESGADAVVPLHPACRDCPTPEECRKAWRAHVAQLLRRPEVHWHRCKRGILCGVVPFVRDGVAIVACRVACSGEMADERFERHVELLEVLMENLAIRQHWNGSPRGTSVLGDAIGRGTAGAAADVSHPQVQRALQLIEENYTDPQLTVAGIARGLNINATYLAHLFSQQVGVRMSRYVANLRIQRAKQLLSATNWQIKRVAYESGYDNPDWFSQVFHSHTGQSPTAYRVRTRKS
jgi:AraC-like DNA-binding protein